MIGCTPFWGVHFGLCWLVGRAFGLNRLKMYLAANVINPLIVPPLFYAEVQAGSLVRRGHLLALSWDMITSGRVWDFGADLVIGSVVVGLIVGVVGGVVTYVARRPAQDPFFQLLVRRASDRFLDSGITAWEFARGKLSGIRCMPRRSPRSSPLPPGTLLDIGCGQGLMLALVAEAQHTAGRGEWDTDTARPAAVHAPGRRGVAAARGGRREAGAGARGRDPVGRRAASGPCQPPTSCCCSTCCT